MTAVRYLNVAAVLRQRIASNMYAVGTMFPPLHELQKDPEIMASRDTVRRAIDELERDGLVVTTQGRGGGTKVRENSVIPGTAWTSGTNPQNWAQQNPGGVDRLESSEWSTADEDVAERLGIEPGSPVVYRVRHMTYGAGIAQLFHQWIPKAVADAIREKVGYDLVEDIHEQPENLFIMAARSGYAPYNATETISPRMPTSDEWRELEIPSEMPVQVTVRVTPSRAGIVETMTSIVPGDRAKASFTVPLDYSEYEPSDA